MPNILSSSVIALAPAQISVGVASTTVSAYNNQRVGLVAVNISAGTIYITAGNSNSAVVGTGIALNANGGVWVMDEYTFTIEQISAIAHSASSALSVQEFVIRS